MAYFTDVHMHRQVSIRSSERTIVAIYSLNEVLLTWISAIAVCHEYVWVRWNPWEIQLRPHSITLDSVDCILPWLSIKMLSKCNVQYFPSIIDVAWVFVGRRCHIIMSCITTYYTGKLSTHTNFNLCTDGFHSFANAHELNPIASSSFIIKFLCTKVN